ncbi:hypothetical protein H6P81_011819 [Aristolochia fimbriata]|uniref:Pentatricopeptide repeat-containing protein n=1 Tax=Aristolochia fimbriata TaxID=158543 RepID=A0AAV7ECX9_ARIFI|nr:hypothetical protein H6P81_011819 [Aristolochia fimbriata]
MRFSSVTKATQAQTLDYKDTHFMKLLNRSCKTGKYDEALHFLEYMVKKGYRPDVILCTKLIKGFFNLRNVEKAVKVMEILEAHGSPDVFAYNALISGFCKASRIESATEAHRMDAAINLLAQMVEKGCRPNETTYVLLTEGFAYAGWRSEAMELAKELIARHAVSEAFLKRLNRNFAVLAS